jgi:hypothetical protein
MAKAKALAVTLRVAGATYRFCKVLIEGDDVYIFAAGPVEPLKVSYHESGQKHLKRQAKTQESKPKFVVEPIYITPTREILTEEMPWARSLDGLQYLQLFTGRKKAFAVCELQRPEGLEAFATVSIGREFNEDAWVFEGARLSTITKSIYSVPSHPTGLKICVRLAILSPVDEL